MNRLQQLHDAGVSIWLDTLSRELLDSGAFAALIADCAVTGATSNPTIFAKAITGSDRYDDQLRAAGRLRRARPAGALLRSSRSTTSAAPPTCCARPTTRSDGRDGFVSFECTPDLADDTAATIEQALELWERLARPNVMIKVPATDGRHPRDRGAHRPRRQRQRHAAVLRRALRAGHRRLPRAASSGACRAGEPVDAIASVASFFVSRVDAKADAAAAGRLAAARPRRDRQRPPRLRPLPRALRRRALAGAARRRRAPAATAVGQHRHQGPRLLRRALRRGADRPRRHQHDARGDPARLRRPRRGHARPQRRAPRRPRSILRRAERAGIDLAAITAQLEREGVRVLLRLLPRAARAHRDQDRHRSTPTVRTSARADANP